MKKEENKQVKKKKTLLRTKQDKALLATFGALVVLVVILAIVALNMKKITAEDNANIVIPILEKSTESEISVDISDMKKGDVKEYVFKVANYKERNVIEKKLAYDIAITPSENATIKLFKNGSDENLIYGDDLLIEDNKLPKKEKKADEYLLIIEAIQEPETKDVISIKINS